MSALLALALATQMVAAEPPPANKPRLLVLEFKDNGVGKEAVATITETLVAHLSENRRVEVTSSEDVRRIIDEQATKLELGCEADSCMSEIAGALGAQLTIYGTAGKLGDLIIVNVSLFDARANATIGRESVEVKSLADLPGPLRNAGDRLMARLEPDAGPAPGPLFVGGAALGSSGLLLGIVGAIFWVPNINGYANDEVNDSFQKKSSSRLAENTGAALVASGAGAVVVGASLLALSLAVE